MGRKSNRHKILIVGTSPETKGGVTTVIKSYQNTHVWEKWNCVWVSTNVDKNYFLKIAEAFRGFILLLYYLPFSQIVHIHFSWSVSAFRKLPFFVVSKLFNKKVIMHLHSGSEPIIESKFRKVYQFYFNYSDLVIFLSHSIKEELKSVFHINSCTVLSNPCSITLSGKSDITQKNILFVGQICKKKGVYDLVHAFNAISESYYDWRLILAGAGEIEELRSLIKKLAIEDRVELLGWITGEEKSDAFRRSSIFCLPSYTEGFPMAVLEAFAYGLPVITTPVGGITDIAKNNENMLLFEPGDIEALTDALNQLMGNESLRIKLSEESIKLSQKVFNIDVLAEQLDKIYHKIIKNE